MAIRQTVFPTFKVDDNTPLCQLVNWLVCEPRAGIFWFEYSRWLMGMPEQWDHTPKEIREQFLFILDHLDDALTR